MECEGSSPLARGLRVRPNDSQGVSGIIPARAGFTSPRLTASRPGWDHPRSRGVYGRRVVDSAVPAGSSPLARGLLVTLPVSRCLVWIIPARAGFTPAQSRIEMPLIGSSPLARGLRALRVRGPVVGRIIPARAGFTCSGRGRPSPWPDHPRSRGVYKLASAVRFSSVDGKIIPARAGFTRWPASRSHSSEDHPRSRGVYPHASTLEVAGNGIIPARAGFTREVVSQYRVVGDHPRSRGVYAYDADDAAYRAGSSPLARGLQNVSGRRILLRRIIPARAGFTYPHARTSRTPGDHPRSRGVYRAHLTGLEFAGGSSPLARGLRPAGDLHTPQERIIPARAGFTAAPSTPKTQSRDHPRSRGVYRRQVLHGRRLTGSSPLARGLQARPGYHWVVRRIIPARAGFTVRR